MQAVLHLLKSRRFMPLFVTQFFGAFNDNVLKNALLIWITYTSSQLDALAGSVMVNLAAGLFILPFFLFSATAGQIADKYDKAWLARKIKQFELLLMLICGYCLLAESLAGLFCVLFLMGVQSSFFGPIKYSLLPEHLKKQELIVGNGLIEFGTFFSILCGTLFGGCIIRSQFGAESLALSLILFSLIGYLSSRLIPAGRCNHPQLKITWNIVLETGKIIGQARAQSGLWLPMLAISWFWFVGAICLAQFPRYAKQIIGGDESIVTLFLVLFCLGVGAGSICCNALLKGRIHARIVPYGCAGMSLALFLLVAASYGYGHQASSLDFAPKELLSATQFLQQGCLTWGMVFSLWLLAFSAGLYIVPLYAILQQRSPSQIVGRMIAANNIMNAFFMVTASLLALLVFALGCGLMQLFFGVAVLNFGVFFMVSRIVYQKGKNG